MPIGTTLAKNIIQLSNYATLIVENHFIEFCLATGIIPPFQFLNEKSNYKI